MRHTFHSEQWLPYSADVVFAFFANPENLPRLMPPWQKARIEEASFAPPPPRPTSSQSMRIAAGSGSHITLSFRPIPYLPIRLLWEAEIDEFVWNSHFADRQIRGPFAYWHHRHTVQQEARANSAGTLLRDEIEYEPPLGPLGEIAGVLIAHQLRTTFGYRKLRTTELLPRTHNSTPSHQK